MTEDMKEANGLPKTIENLKSRIKRHEGWTPVMKPDMDGYVLGWGHNLAMPISERAGSIILTDDLGGAIKDFFKLPVEMRKKLDPVRTEVLVEMIFQLGLSRFLEFKRMIAAIEKGDFEKAAMEIMDSLAATQARNRFLEYSKMMRDGAA